MDGSAAIVLVPYGAAAVGALGGALRAAQAGDALAPVTVVIPSAHVAVSVRRHLARLPHDDGRTGLVNVQWRSLPQVADLLAAESLRHEQRPPLTDVTRRAAIRGALDHAPGRFAAVVDNPSTEQRLDRTFTELRDLDDPELDALAQLGGRPHDLVRLHRAVRARCAAFADPREVLDRATAAVAAGAPALGALGQVVAYLPTRLSRAERRLLVELARAGRLTVLLGLTGDATADEATRALAAALAADLGTAPVEVATDPTLAAASRAPSFVRAPDPDEEVRVAVRRVLEALEQGLAPDDIAIVARVRDPYAVLVHEHLAVAGVPHYGPASVAASQSVAGRTLLGFLSLAQHGFRRADLFRWVRSAPVRFPDGRPIPAGYDNLARRAGVARGIDQWQQRLRRVAGADDDRDPERHARVVEQVEGLLALVQGLAALAVPPEPASWAAYASWAASLLDTLLGGRRAVDAWPEAERVAFDQVHQVLTSLAALGAVEPEVDARRFHRVLEQELSQPSRPVGAFGHGVFVGLVADLAGARHELVLVLGMAEGIFPPRATEDSLLPDHERRTLGGALPDRRPSRGDEKRALLAAMHAAPRTQLSFARVDAGGQREAIPSRLYLHELSAVVGEHVGFDDLDAVAAGVAAGRLAVDLLDVPSFQAGALEARAPVGAQEVAVAALLRGSAPDAALARGVAAVVDRVEGRFGEWTGFAGPEHAPRFTGERVGSATSFEQWAGCPFRYFLSHVLSVRPLDRFADAEVISGLDRGSLVHRALEVFIDEHRGRAPDAAWTADDHEQLRAITTGVAAEFESGGKTGRPLLWQIELDTLLRRLETILEVDARQRATGTVEPLAVELVFGPVDDGSDAPPVEFVLPSGRVVSFRGAIDRVDRDPSSGRLVVIDYKTGKATGYEDIADDITCRGRHLQLVIYGEAARRHFGADLVDAYYWFVEQKGSSLLAGGPIDDAARDRFLDVLEVIVDGIERGAFPANPGVPDYWGFSHCGFCDFQRVCPSDRDDLWEGVRLSGAIADYVRLADPDPDLDPDSDSDPDPDSDPDAGAGAALDPRSARGPGAVP